MASEKYGDLNENTCCGLNDLWINEWIKNIEFASARTKTQATKK